MQKRIFIIILTILLILDLYACSLLSREGDGELRFDFDLSYPASKGYSITQVHATLVHQIEGTTIERDLEVDAADNKASGVISGLRIGKWDLAVSLFENGTEVGSGTAEVEVKAGETAVVNITINLYSGSVEIHVQWGTDFEEYGALLLMISSGGIAAKTIVPPLDMDIAYYDVYGDGPDSATLSRPGIAGPEFAESSLLVGKWTIAVDAFNADDDLIGSGSVAVTIAARQTTEAEVSVAPLQGTGSLHISISWPAGTVVSPVVTGTLTATGGTPQSVAFTLGENSASYSSSALDVGYYALQVQLYDGGVLTWGWMESVRILKDQFSEAAITL